MKVYILVCNWMHDGGNVVNQIAGVFATLKSARKAMAEKFSEDIQNRDYESYRFDKTVRIYETKDGIKTDRTELIER